jgi:hypothetical protein
MAYPTSAPSKLPPDPYPTTRARFVPIAADNAVPVVPRPEPVFPYPVSKPKLVQPKQVSYPVSHPKQDLDPKVLQAVLQGAQEDLEE